MDLSLFEGKTMKKANIFIAILFALLGVIIIAISMTYPPSKHGVPGPGVFPIIIGVIILLASATLMIKTVIVSEKIPDIKKIFGSEFFNVFITMGGLVVYLVFMPMIGFIVSTAILLVLFIRWFAKKSWWLSGLIGILFTLGVFALFSLVLNVPMSFGLLI